MVGARGDGVAGAAGGVFAGVLVGVGLLGEVPLEVMGRCDAWLGVLSRWRGPRAGRWREAAGRPVAGSRPTIRATADSVIQGAARKPGLNLCASGRAQILQSHQAAVEMASGLAITD